MKFVEAILSNNTTDDHCREFVTQKGLVPLMGILGLPNLPIDFPSSPSCQAVAIVCKSILASILYNFPCCKLVVNQNECTAIQCHAPLVTKIILQCITTR